MTNVMATREGVSSSSAAWVREGTLLCSGTRVTRPELRSNTKPRDGPTTPLRSHPMPTSLSSSTTSCQGSGSTSSWQRSPLSDTSTSKVTWMPGLDAVFAVNRSSWHTRAIQQAGSTPKTPTISATTALDRRLDYPATTAALAKNLAGSGWRRRHVIAMGRSPVWLT